MQVAYEIKLDQWGGHGIFATKDIGAGTLIWSSPKAALTIRSNADAKVYCASLSQEELKVTLTYCYFSDDHKMIDITKDDGRYFNHTNAQPNVALGNVAQAHLHNQQDLERASSYALLDIAAGAELVDDYNTYGASPQWYDDLLDENGIDESYINPK